MLQSEIVKFQLLELLLDVNTYDRKPNHECMNFGV